MFFNMFLAALFNRAKNLEKTHMRQIGAKNDQNLAKKWSQLDCYSVRLLLGQAIKLFDIKRLVQKLFLAYQRRSS